MKHVHVLFLFFLCLLGALLAFCTRSEDLSVSIAPLKDSVLIQYNSLLKEKQAPYGEKLALNHQLLTRYDALKDSIVYALLRDRIGLLRSNNQLDSALFYSQKMFDRAEQVSDSSIMAEAHFRLGFYNRLLDNYENSLRHYYAANELYIGLKDSANAGAKLLNLANLLNFLGNYSEAENTAVEGLRYIEHSDSTRYISGLYNALAISTKERRNYDDALSWYQKALRIQPDTLDLVNIENNIASIYVVQGNYNESIEVFERLLNHPIAALGRNPTTYARILDNLGDAQSKSGLPIGEANLLRALEIRDSLNFLTGKFASYLHLAEHYLGRNTAKSQEMALEAFRLSNVLKNPDNELLSLALLIKIAPNPKEYAIRYEALNDSLLRAGQVIKDEYAKIRYDSEQNLRNFLEAQNLASIQTLALERSNKRNLLLLGALISLAAVGYVSFRWIRSRHKKKELEAIYHTETTISKKVHDELANDLFNILNRAVNEGPKTDHQKLVENLDQVYQKSRDISRDRAEIPSGEAFERALKLLVQNYSSGSIKVITKGYDSIPWGKLDPLKQVGIYRTMQELLVNMKKHSQANLVFLDFSKMPKQIQIRYKDNGLGINKKDLTKGQGLPNTENRIRALGGTFTFEKDAQKGLGILITVPV